jgi:hypothetical protein
MKIISYVHPVSIGHLNSPTPIGIYRRRYATMDPYGQMAIYYWDLRPLLEDQLDVGYSQCLEIVYGRHAHCFLRVYVTDLFFLEIFRICSLLS